MRNILLFGILIMFFFFSLDINAEKINSGSQGVILRNIMCNDEGLFRFTLSPNSNFWRIYLDDIKIDLQDALNNSKKFERGWDEQYKYLAPSISSINFTSEDAVFNKQGQYRLKLDYKVAENNGVYSLAETDFYEFSCPGLFFSCKMLDIEIKSCKYNDKGDFQVLTHIEGLDQKRRIDIKDMNYELWTEDSYKDLNGRKSKHGTLPEGYRVISNSNNDYLYIGRLKNPNVIQNVKISYPNEIISNCLSAKDLRFYSYSDCDAGLDEKPVEMASKSEKQLSKQQDESVKKEVQQEISQKENLGLKTKEANINLNLIVGAVIIAIAIIIGFWIHGKRHR